jgi:ubiquinone/menaquinone biosynthesis C-methylase UbiE
MQRPEFIARQSGRPSGWLGRILAHIMAFETAAANQTALQLLHLGATDRLLEIGFGHGRTIERAAALVPHGCVAGVDHADTMVRSAQRRCAALIASGRVRLHAGDSARLPFPDASFDKALAVHTLYFWRPPQVHLREIRRVLAAGGRLVLAYRPAGSPGATSFPDSVYAFHSPADVRELLGGAGFDTIETVEHSPDLVLTAAHAGEARSAFAEQGDTP